MLPCEPVAQRKRRETATVKLPPIARSQQHGLLRPQREAHLLDSLRLRCRARLLPRRCTAP